MIARFLQAIIRFTYSFENLGMISAIKIIWFRILKKSINVKISTKKFGEVFWNTKRDWVITHFYTPQIEIFSPNGLSKREPLLRSQRSPLSCLPTKFYER